MTTHIDWSNASKLRLRWHTETDPYSPDTTLDLDLWHASQTGSLADLLRYATHAHTKHTSLRQRVANRQKTRTFVRLVVKRGYAAVERIA